MYPLNDSIGYFTAEYSASVWATPFNAHILGQELNQECRTITGCLMSTNLLSGICPVSIRRDICGRVERTKQNIHEAHSLFGHSPAQARQKYRYCFLSTVKPVHFPHKVHLIERLERDAADNVARNYYQPLGEPRY